MTQPKVMVVFGTRPEAIKMAPLVRLLRNDDRFEPIITVTGQHRQMLDQVLDIFDITPDFDLNIMKSGQDLYDVTAKVITGLRDIISQTRPDIILVHGDTTTSMGAALAAYYARIPVGHVEAGLRTHNIYSPWPEEINRQITGRIASLHFAPTPLSKENLIKENVAENNIHITGNTVIDALHQIQATLASDKELSRTTDRRLLAAGYDVGRLSRPESKLVLITGHRRENFGDGFISICNALNRLARQFPNVDFVYPMHLNPNVRGPIHQVFGQNLKDAPANIFFIEPLDYTSFNRILYLSDIVLTDSGGIQEEAPGLGKPVLVMRDTTERPEAVEAGTVRLVGTDFDAIVDNCSRLLTDEAEYNQMSQAQNPYGDGHASERILNAIFNHFNQL